MATSNVPLAHHFEDLQQQHEANTLGMWMFLATEVLFFGGLFTGYTIYRSQPQYSADFEAASKRLIVWLGAVNTAVLICSSLTMALALYSARLGNRKGLIGFLGATTLLGSTFLGIKAVEYKIDYDEWLIPGFKFEFNKVHEELRSEDAGRPIDPHHAELFFVFYFVMTLVHALHMVIGIGVLLLLLLLSIRGRYSSVYHTPIEVAGLYWHFVDIIWVFLFPLLYLVRH